MSARATVSESPRVGAGQREGRTEITDGGGQSRATARVVPAGPVAFVGVAVGMREGAPILDIVEALVQWHVPTTGHGHDVEHVEGGGRTSRATPP